MYEVLGELSTEFVPSNTLKDIAIECKMWLETHKIIFICDYNYINPKERESDEII